MVRSETGRDVCCDDDLCVRQRSCTAVALDHARQSLRLQRQHHYFTRVVTCHSQKGHASEELAPATLCQAGPRAFAHAAPFV